MRRSGGPFTLPDRLAVAVSAAAAGAIMALDGIPCVRLVAFAWNPPAAHELETQVRHEQFSRKKARCCALRRVTVGSA